MRKIFQKWHLKSKFGEYFFRMLNTFRNIKHPLWSILYGILLHNLLNFLSKTPYKQKNWQPISKNLRIKQALTNQVWTLIWILFLVPVLDSMCQPIHPLTRRTVKRNLTKYGSFQIGWTMFPQYRLTMFSYELEDRNQKKSLTKSSHLVSSSVICKLQFAWNYNTNRNDM